MNFSFSVSRKDFIKKLVIVPVGPTCVATNVAVADQLGTANRISGVLRPHLPFRRIQVTLGQQQIVILSQGVVGEDDFIDSNLSEYPYLFFSSEA